MRFTDLTYLEIADAVAAGAIAVVPTGCTEQQGPHLGVGFDSWFAEEIAVAGAEVARERGVTALVLPALPYGPTPEHRGFGSGFIDVPVSIQDAVVDATLRSLADQGFRRVVVWRGCGEHDLSAVVEQVNGGRADVRVHLPELPYADIWAEVGDPNVPGGHADSFATSLALYRHPELVRVDAIPREPSRQPNWSDRRLDFSAVSTTGVVGTAANASAELGRKLWDTCAARIAETFVGVARERL